MISRILVLVIASDSPAHYLEMQKVWTKWTYKQVISNAPIGAQVNSSAQVFDVWFVKAKPERLWIGDIVNDGPLSDIIEIDNDAMTIFVKGDETYIPGILNKTIEAIRYFGKGAFPEGALPEGAFPEGALPKGFDYIWRTNLSSILDFDGLLRYIDSGVSGCYSGYIGEATNISNPCTSITCIRFASGSGFLLNRCAIDYLIENEHLLRRDLIDDVAIGALLEPRFGLTHIDRCWVDESLVFPDNVFHFRCETYQHLRTIEFMNATAKYIDSKTCK